MAPPAALVAVVVVVLAAASSGGEATITPEAYALRLERAKGLADEGIAVPSPSAMDGVRDAVGWPVAVDLGAAPVTIAPDPLLQTLDGTDANDFRAATLRLAAHSEALSRAASTAALDRDRLEAALTRAYAGLEEAGPGPVQRVLAVVMEFLGGLVDRLARLSAPVALGIALLVALLVAGLLVTRRAGLVPERTASRARLRPSTPTDWLRLAEEARARGEFHEAVRALYRALLATLAARGVLRDVPSLTAGECRRELFASRPALLPAVGRATETYERVAYGLASAGPEDVEVLRRAERAARTG